LPIPPFRDDGWLPIGHHPATWEEVTARFGGDAGSRRAWLTGKLLELRDALRACGVTGRVLLNGSYVSAKTDPEDFDLLLIGPPDIQARKDSGPDLAALLDPEHVEKAYGCSLFYVSSESSALGDIITLWDLTRDKVAKGSVEVEL
jgi:hypothetical protein